LIAVNNKGRLFFNPVVTRSPPDLLAGKTS
jgi:hypothetical protein